MAPVSYLFIAALVFSFCSVQGQDGGTNIYDEMGRCRSAQFSISCPDYSQLISCLEKLWTRNFTDDEQKAVNRSIDFYALKRDECPGVTDKGKCVTQEVNSCLAKHYGPGRDSWKDCKSLETAIQCIDEVVTACNDDYAVQEKDFLSEGKARYCDLSDPVKKCIDGVDACWAMISYPDLSPNGDISTCDRLSSAHGCMDKVLSDSVCNATDSVRTKVSENREYFDEVARHCQLASGPCTAVAMRNCTSIVYDLNIFPCPTPKVEEVRKCLDALEPKCTTDYQKYVLDTEWQFTARDCFYTIETTTTST